MFDDNNTVLYYKQQISSILGKHNYQKLVVQVPKQLLSISFSLTSSLRQLHPQTGIYILYDSLKQSCCTDVLGAEHLAYDGLVHLGPACFSEPHRDNHHYIFEPAESEHLKQLQESLVSDQTMKYVKQHQIGYLVVQQQYYRHVKQLLQSQEGQQLNNTEIQLMRLPFDQIQQHQYFVCGYYLNPTGLKNILLIDSPQDTTESMTLAQHISFSLKSLSGLVGPQMHLLTPAEPLCSKYCFQQNKLLMQRYSLISQLNQHDIFGVIISNTATAFHLTALEWCQRVLKKAGKKSFTFTMNNLNEVKLGNFPEIQVYVVVACYINSLFALKDFHRLVVTPNDLAVAFDQRSFDQYIIDNRTITPDIHSKQQQLKPEHEKPKAAQQQLAKLKAGDLVLKDKIQTLDFYRDRQFKGLEFSSPKEVTKLTKGKVGLAQQYTPLQ